jgi:Domain of unknown function (DUF1707)
MGVTGGKATWAAAMAGLENERAANSGRGRLRASHGDREHVVDTLKAAYVHGLMTKDEFDARVSQTFASRTYAELALITADIPAGLAAAPPPLRTGPAKASSPAHANLTPGERAIMGTGLLAALAIVVALLTGGPVGGLLGLGTLGSAFVSLCLIGAQVHSSRRNTHSGAVTCLRSGQLTAVREPAARRHPLPRQDSSRTPASPGGAATLTLPTTIP